MENKKGQGIFLGVVGVATLVVAIIGATFAYFSASTSSNATDLQGQTLGAQGGVLQLKVEKIDWDDAQATSNDLVPANITTANAQAAITAKCEATSGETGDTNKYTGCHLYRVAAKAGSAVASATLTFDSLTLTNVQDKADWNHAMWSTTDASDKESGYTLGSNIAAATGTNAFTAAKTVETAAYTAGQERVYYLLIYVANASEVQNDGTAEHDVTGSYSGIFTFEAAGGNKVMATFTS